MKNPNHFGSVTKLKGNRRRPWVAKEGLTGKQKPIGYAATKQEAIIILAEYNKTPWDIDTGKMTLEKLYNLWLNTKSGKMKKNSLNVLTSAYNKHIKVLGNKEYRKLKFYEMQALIDNCGRGPSTQNSIKNLFHHLDKFALEIDVPTNKYSEALTPEPARESVKTMFSDADVGLLWANKDHPWVDAVLFLLYSGFRATELCNIQLADINTDDWYITGGIKTKAGKNRIVPVHSRIMDIVKNHMETSQSGYLFEVKGKQMTYQQFKDRFEKLMDTYHLSYNPHECRHTFRSWLDSAGANQVCIDRLMGHVSEGTGRRVYTHKTIEELRTNLELIT